MTYTPKILAFAGSTRAGSFNKQLVSIAAEGARAAGAEVTLVDLRDLPMPLFDEDLEAKDGMPPGGREFKDLLLAHDGLLISAPEYNSSISAVLKNAIDWASRREEGEAPLACFKGKTAVIMSASPGGLGGLRGLVVLRMLLGNIQVNVLPDQKAIAEAHEALTPEGLLADSRQEEAVKALGARLAEVLAKLHG
jgi:NAD(P)H-dependent FMN reductase